jgi:hypothetical protein
MAEGKDKSAEFVSSPHAATSVTLSRRQLFLARVGWQMVFVLSIGLLFATIPVYYEWLINIADPDLEPATVRANLEANGISIYSYATYLLSMQVAFTIAWVAVGVVIYWRRSDDWMALFTSLSLITFGTYTIYKGATVLAEQYSASQLLVHLLGFFGSVSFVLFFSLFPDGRFVPRWTRWMAIVWVAHEMAYYFFRGSFFDLDSSFPQIDYVVALTFACIIAGSQLYRYLRVSGPVQRQQTKWVVFGTVSAMLGAMGFQLAYYIFPTMIPYGSPYALAIETGVFGSLLLIPVSIGMAILRHRLWDIDIIINRTLVYSSLTALLALVYFGGVAATQALFRALTSQEEQPQLAIVVSTLVIAALFNPLRRRIHGFIDRRFYRRKYDARKTLEALSAKLRDETDLDAVSDDLVGVVKDTMQPAHVSVWLRPDLPSRESEGREQVS